MKPNIELQTDAFPLVVTTLRGRPEDPEFEAYFTAFERVVARKRPFVSLVDTSALEAVPTPAQRKRIAAVQAEWLGRHGSDMGVAVAMVVQNSLVRGAITALHWLMPPPVPTQAFGDRRQALQYLVDMLKQRGIPVSDGIQAMLTADRLAG